MYTWRAAGQGVRAIAERLNKAGYTMRGKRWATSSVHNILNSTAVQGLTTFNRRSDGGHGIENDPSQWVIVQRSEEHTSDLQSLMRISYAVFCLQTKNHQTLQHETT